MTVESLDAGAAADVPEARRAVDRARQAVVASEVELGARELRRVPFERVNALARAHIPNLSR